MIINDKLVDLDSFIVEDVFTDDYPDFCDAFISYATFRDGTELTAEEVMGLNEKYPEIAQELAFESLLD